MAAADPGPERHAPGGAELATLARDLLPAVERGAGLSFRREPAVARASEERLRDFLREQLERQLPPERARAIRDTYARFGLLPPELDLRAVLAELYREQVGGFYDPATDTLFVRSGLEADLLPPTLVHELVHALQDQHRNLDSLTRALESRSDRALAARAAIEGHATFVMTEWALSRQAGRKVDLTEERELAGLLGVLETLAAAASPALASTPPVLRQSLLFPYVEGLGFTLRLWTRFPGRPFPLGERMPRSTEEVLHYGTRTGNAPDPPVEVELPGPPPGWKTRHEDTLGELETRLLLRTFLSDSARADRAAAGWGGDRYRLLGGPDGRGALLWITAWDTAEDAADFEDAVREALAARPQSGFATREVSVRRGRRAGSPAVVVLDLDVGAAPPTGLLPETLLISP